MQPLHKVYYFEKNIYLIKAGQEASPSIPYEIKSTTPGLISEEIVAFLKKETDSHFLHANEFEHWNMSRKMLTIPLSVYDPQCKDTYWERMFDASSKDYQVEEYSNKSLNIQLIYEVPLWLNGFLRMYFNKQFSQSIVGEILADPKKGGLQMDMVIEKGHFIFSLRNDRELYYLNVHAYDSIEDILYTLLNIITRQNKKLDNVTCNLFGFCSTLTVQTLQENLKKIKLLESIEFKTCVKPFL